MLIKISNFFTRISNKLKGIFLCTLIGHDWFLTQCFRCWKWDKDKGL